MIQFGELRPPRFGQVLMFAVRLGLGRGKLKHFFAFMWKSIIGVTLVDVRYHGLKLRLLTHGNTIESKIIFSSKLRESRELDEIRAVLSEGGTFIDIGANIGYYSLMAAHFGASRIYAFEPNPDLAARFRSNADLNSFGAKIQVLEYALGAVSGMSRLSLGKDDLGSSSIIHVQDGNGSIEVAVEPLSEMLGRLRVDRIDVMKIDVEGMEDKILRPFFESVKPSLYPKMMIIEDSSQTSWDWNVVAWLLANGYRVKSQSRGNLILSRSEEGAGPNRIPSGHGVKSA